MTVRQFTDTFVPLKESLYRVEYYILESRQDAEDALQDLFVRLWNSRDTLDCILNPKAYCMTMMKDMPYDEISERTGMNNLTLRVLLSRARRKIRYVNETY